jgi:hypothetical protein
LESAEELYQRRVTRILTTDFPVYFALVSRIRQEVKVISKEGGIMSSTVIPQVQAVFPDGAITKGIRVGLQVIMIKFLVKPVSLLHLALQTCLCLDSYVHVVLMC